jgi:hypothetical protein
VRSILKPGLFSRDGDVDVRKWTAAVDIELPAKYK